MRIDHAGIEGHVNPIYPLLETIKLEDRKFHNIALHADRMRASRRALFGIDESVDLERFLTIPDGIGNERYRCRLLYGKAPGPVEYLRYEVRSVRSLRVVDAGMIDYAHKYADRTSLERAKRLAAGCDEIIIELHGLLTDTTYSNIALFDGRRWFTPQTPLLAGTRRAELIDSGVIAPARITADDLCRFESISLINSMLDLGEVIVPITSVELYRHL